MFTACIVTVAAFGLWWYRPQLDVFYYARAPELVGQYWDVTQYASKWVACFIFALVACLAAIEGIKRREAIASTFKGVGAASATLLQGLFGTGHSKENSDLVIIV